MANSASARKRIRQTDTKTRLNKLTSNRLKAARKEFGVLVAEGKSDEAKKAMNEVFARADRAAKTGVIHKNAASRIKSRAASALAPKKEA